VQLTEKQFREACARLERDGLITKESRGIWRAARKGEEKALALMAGIDRRESYPAPQGGSSRTIVIFDVPEKQREKRACIRAELAALEFKPLQKSVWIGSIPLPKKCMEYFRDIEVIPHIHVFSINRPGTIV
jgi:DNA-binding transcriptional regulator PaaX